MFTINTQIVENVFNNLSSRIPTNDRSVAMRFALRLIDTEYTFQTSSEAAAFVAADLWNSGFVQ